MNAHNIYVRPKLRSGLRTICNPMNTTNFLKVKDKQGRPQGGLKGASNQKIPYPKPLLHSKKS